MQFKLLIFAVAIAGVSAGGPICKPPQVYRGCVSACPLTCANWDKDEPCPLPCKHRCECPPEAPVEHLTDDGELSCITGDMCCPEGKVWNECAPSCPPACNPVPGPCTLECQQRCTCPPQRPIETEDGRCISADECPPPECPEGQVYMECGSACDRTCKDPNPICTLQCVERCECPFGTLLHDGKCITPEECPQALECEPPLVYLGCASACPLTCANWDKIEICTLQCVHRCECPADAPVQDLTYDNKIRCITGEMCCPEGKVWNECAPSCPPECNPVPKPCTAECQQRCTCPRNAPIETEDGRCISADQCPPPECPEGQVYMECGSACDATCEDPNPPCTLQCVTRCQCPFGTLLHDGKCITPEECPPALECEPPLVYLGCASACPLTCANWDKIEICTLQCVHRCECPADAPVQDLTYDNKIRCITGDMCCPEGKVWNDCAPSCPPECNPVPKLCTLECQQRCTCPRNTPIETEDGRCISADQCPPPDCPEGQVYMECGSACDATCEDPNPPCILLCVARCQCPFGTLLDDGKCITPEECRY